MLRPTFLSFETARNTIAAAQYGLDTVGHNISNEHTPGYTRQRVDQVSFALNPRGRFSQYGKTLPGMGTDVLGINRIRDPFLDNRYRLEATNVAELDVLSRAYKDINTVFDEIKNNGLHDKFDKLIDAFAKLETDYSNSEFKLVIRTEAEQIALLMNKYAKDLNGVENHQKEALGSCVLDLNETLKKIAFYNEKIAEQHVYGNPANELMDERDLLLDRLAEFTDITITREEVVVSEERSYEKLIIKMNGLGSNIELVNGKQHASFTLDTSGTPASISMTTPYGTSYGDATRLFEKGEIKAYFDILNGNGTYAAAGENGTRGIPYYREAFNEMAKVFADTMNWVNNGCQVNGSGDPIIPPISDTTNLFTYNPLNPAESIRISDEWRGNLEQLQTHLFENPPPPDGTGDPRLVLKFKEALGVSLHDFSNGSAGNITGTFQEYFVAFTAQMAQDQSMSEALLDAGIKVIGGLMDNRDAVSAVSMNEESINMMTYQNYYNAALRYMTTLDEALNQLINNMGIVGR